jgi:hypothetical protein
MVVRRWSRLLTFLAVAAVALGVVGAASAQTTRTCIDAFGDAFQLPLGITCGSVGAFAPGAGAGLCLAPDGVTLVTCPSSSPTIVTPSTQTCINSVGNAFQLTTSQSCASVGAYAPGASGGLCLAPDGVTLITCPSSSPAVVTSSTQTCISASGNTFQLTTSVTCASVGAYAPAANAGLCLATDGVTLVTCPSPQSTPVVQPATPPVVAVTPTTPECGSTTNHVASGSPC